MLTCSESDVASVMNHHQKGWVDLVFEIQFENGDSETDDVGWRSKNVRNVENFSTRKNYRNFEMLITSFICISLKIQRFASHQRNKDLLEDGNCYQKLRCSIMLDFRIANS